MTGVFFLGFFAAMLLCFVPSVLAYRALRQRRLAHADYRERWLEAVTLLGGEGRLTEEQVRSLRSDSVAPPAPVPSPAITPVHAPAPAPAVTITTLKTLHGMLSSDRRKAEIARAENGLPPLDDLKGMLSSDQRKVLQARMENGTG